MLRRVARQIAARAVVVACSASFIAAFPLIGLAGGGPENVFLAVSEDSYASKTVANHYIKIRGIPASNVLYLKGIPAGDTFAVEPFRRRILKPILQAIEKRNLQDHIDYIVYSDGFPTRVHIGYDTIRDPSRKYPTHFKPFASINALTYYAEQVSANRADYYQLNSNRYMRVPRSLMRVSPFTGALALKFVDAARLLTAKQYAEAEASLAEIAENQPDQALVHALRAAALAGLGKQDEAIDSVQKAVACDWCDRTFFEREATFKLLRANPKFKEVLASLPPPADPYLPTASFEHKTIWAPNGLYNSTPEQGEQYYLSTVLAATHSQGLSLAEHLHYLDRAVLADGTAPKGTFYFASTKDVRTKTRAKQYPVAAAALKELGYPSAVVPSWAPMGKRDILGLSFGVARYRWSETQSRLLSGSIAECLTSTGGNFAKPNQTPLTEMLRAGAAGSSGAVVEPFAIPNKFPNAMIYPHYVRGASLAEAYYQSVHAPYQLLIVGDALCQPWARPVPFNVKGIAAGEKLDAPRELEFAASGEDADKIEEFRVFVDGVLRGVSAPGDSYRLTKVKLGLGAHELRIVAVRRDNVASQSRQIIPFRVGDHAITLRADPVSNLRGQDVGIRASLIGAAASTPAETPIVVYQNSRKIGTIDAPDKLLNVNAEALGGGTVQIRARAVLGGKATWSPTIWIKVPASNRQ
ncbi:hypothetical protein OAS39_08360 [Pirellulales bacterium]|nr:hypothetical protein [Pirellulales bacterium]